MTDIANIQSLAVAANTVTNVSLHTVFAENASVSTAYEVLSNLDDATITQLGTAGDGIEGVSTDNTDDKSGGQGGLVLTVKGLDTSFNKKESTITLNGTTVVEHADTDWTWINEAFVSGVGTLLNATGAVSITNDASANTIALIDAGKYRSENCWWKVPAGHTGYVHGFWYECSPDSAAVGGVQFALQIALHGLQGVASSEVWQTVAKVRLEEPDTATAVDLGRGIANTHVFSFPGNVPVVIPEKAIVQLVAKADATNVVPCSGGFNIMIQGSGAGTTTTVN